MSEPHPARDPLLQLVPLDPAVDGIRLVVEQVKVQLAVAGAKLCCSNIELSMSDRALNTSVVLLGEDERASAIKAFRRVLSAVVGRREGHVARVVEQVGCLDDQYFWDWMTRIRGSRRRRSR